MATSVENLSSRRKLALIIGNAKYSQPYNKLPDPTKTINDLNDSLRKMNFDVTMACDLTKHKLTSYIIDFSKKIKDGDLILFYFCGHGLHFNGENYLIPIDDSYIRNDDDLEDFALNLRRTIARLVERNSSYATIMIFDCPSPYVLKSTSASNYGIQGKGLHEIVPPNGAFLQFACAPNQTVGDGSKMVQHKLFTKHLLQNISQENVHVSKVFETVNDAVYQESNGQQMPLSMNGLNQNHEVFLNQVTISAVQPTVFVKPHPDKHWVRRIDDPLASEKEKQKKLKVYYDNFPNIEDVTNTTDPNIKQAEEFTKSILSQLPSGDVINRDTLCHLLAKIYAIDDEEILFFDSDHGENLHDATANMVDTNHEDKPFVLKLKSSEGLGGNNGPRTEDDEIRLAQMLNTAIEKGESHPIIDDILNRLATAHNVDKNAISLKVIYAGSFNVVYNTNGIKLNQRKKLNETVTHLRDQFKQYDCAKLHPLLFRPSFNISYFDERGNKDFLNEAYTFQVGPVGRKKTYTQPTGWTRFGLKVLKRYEDGDGWLEPFNSPNIWYRAFHGTGNAEEKDFPDPNKFSDEKYASIDAMASIYKEGFRLARTAAYGEGVYCSPNPRFPEQEYVKSVRIETQQGEKSYKCMLQVAVNPNGVKCATDDIWVVRKPQDIRPYGILIKDA